MLIDAQSKSKIENRKFYTASAINFAVANSSGVNCSLGLENQSLSLFNGTRWIWAWNFQSNNPTRLRYYLSIPNATCGQDSLIGIGLRIQIKR